MILAALAAVVICLVLLLQQNSRLRRIDDLEQQVLQLQSLLQEGQKGDAALQARQDLLMHSVDGALEKLQARQAESALLTEQKLDQMRRSLTESLDRMQGASQQQLETIRKTVDEKLQQTLERKLNESFRQVSQQLEQVYKGLGEMQSLASGVGDLKKVLSNVKTRGVLGEIQLGAILEQLLTPEQYATNVATKKGSAANVEYAIRLPGSDGAPVWLPIDAKFPLDAYEQVLKAYDTADAAQVESAVKQLKWHHHDKLAHYAKDAYDITYNFPIGFEEIEGIHSRTDFDLSQHQTYSKKDMSYIDQEDGNKKYIPYVIETSAGLNRNFLMFLCEAYEEQNVAKAGEPEDYRTVLHLDPRLAPITVAVLPLMKKDGLAEKAKEIQHMLKEDFVTDYDTSGTVGKRYRRQDEVGTPFCVTVDYDTIQEKKEDGSANELYNTVTIRYRDSMEQERVALDDLVFFIQKAIKNYKPVVRG